MIIHGDLFDVLPTLEAESFDSCVTDPPYGIGFMGKQWDSFSPQTAQRKAGLRQCGQLPRAKQSNPNLRGRKVNGVVSASQIEYDRGLEGQRGFQEWTERWAREVFRVLKPGAHLVVCGAPRSHHRMMSGLEDAGFEIRDCLAWIFGQGFPKSRNLGAGWGTALKPGHEPIALARKPFRGSITANHQALGVGGLNVDGCRIEGDSGSAERRAYGYQPNTERARDSEASGRFRDRSDPAIKAAPHPSDDLGRWPVNVLLDEEAAAMLNEQSGDLVSGFMAAGTQREGIGYHGGLGTMVRHDTKGDSGGASRFFYVAKPSREERDLGCWDLEPRQRDESRKDGKPGGDNPRNRGLQRRGNFHPTVKPLALMRWLVRLVTPIGGRVLEPFGGSGTTAMACAAENFECVLIEREADYIPIIEARVRAIAPLFTAMDQPVGEVRVDGTTGTATPE